MGSAGRGFSMADREWWWLLRWLRMARLTMLVRCMGLRLASGSMAVAGGAMIVDSTVVVEGVVVAGKD